MSQELLIHLIAVPQRTLTAPELVEEFKHFVSQDFSNWNDDAIIVYPTAIAYGRRKLRKTLYELAHNAGLTVTLVVEAFTLDSLLMLNPSRTVTELKAAEASFQPPRIGLDCDDTQLMPMSDFKLDEYATEKVTDQQVKSFTDIIALFDNPVTQFELRLNQDSHDTPYHLESIADHIEMTMAGALENDRFTDELYFIAMFHDLGKALTKQFKDNGHATYQDHAQLSALYAYAFVAQSDLDYGEYQDLVEAIYQHMHIMHMPFSHKQMTRNHWSSELVEIMFAFKDIDSAAAVRNPTLEKD